MQSQELEFPSNPDDLTFEDIDRLVDQLLEKRKEGHIDTSAFSNKLVLVIDESREKYKRRTSIILLRMYQHSNVETSQSVTLMLNELFYFDPQIVVTALADIETHLLEEHRNAKYIDYLINSACGIPQIVTESPDFSEDALTRDANRIISEVRAMDVNNAVKTKIIHIVENWM